MKSRNLGHSSAVVLLSLLFCFGIVLQWLSKAPAAVPSWPLNVIMLILLLGAMGIISRTFGSKPVVLWLGGIKFTRVVLTWLLILTIAAGLVPQGNDAYGWLSQIVNSWPFTFIILATIVNLTLVIFRKIVPLRKRNIGFLLNHGGIWFALVGMSLGVGDIEKLRIYLEEGKETNQGYHQNDEMGVEPIQLPFAIHLRDFQIEEYPAKLAIIDHHSGAILTSEDDKFELKNGAKAKIGDWTVEVLKYLPLAKKVKNDFVPTSEHESVQAAQISLTPVVGSAGSPVTGWVSRPSATNPPSALRLGRLMAALMEPQPKSFRSLVSVKTKTDSIDATIEVNKSLSTSGWKLYQSSYDSRSGKFSRISVLDGVRDPWLPIVYIGAFLLLAGMIFLFLDGIALGSKADREEQV